MSRNLITSRRAGVLAATTVAGVLTMACPAVADVKVDPPSAPQGSGQNVHFTVTNTGQSAITKVKLVIPPQNAIAEVYPLSVDNWAPQITPMKLATPLTSIHNGTPVTETAAAITWIAMPGKALPPGKAADLAVALGPLPLTSSITFDLEATYASGAGPKLPAATLTLTPAEPGAATGHHGGATGTDTGDTDAATFAALVAQSDDGPGFWSIAGWVLAGLALAAAAYLMKRRRTAPARAPDEAEEAEAEAEAEKEPVAAGAPRVTSWSYRDSPE